MSWLSISLISMLLLTTPRAETPAYQNSMDGFYIGLEAMKYSVDPAKPKYKWYHLTHIERRSDSIFVYQNPIAIYRHDTVWSASDGGFYYYRGKIGTNGNRITMNLVMTNCDYCPMPSDSARAEKFGHKLLTGQIINNGILIAGYFYKRSRPSERCERR
jgi:hypothetical protein